MSWKYVLIAICFSLLRISSTFCVCIVFFLIIAVPFPLCTYYALFLVLAVLFYAIVNFVLNNLGGLFVQPVSMNAQRSFCFKNLFVSLYLNRFLFPDGIPLIF